MRRIASLDGLRAVSIALVIAGHAALVVSPVRQRHWLLASYGSLGCSVFFGISGFLITTLLLRERAKTGAISVSAFYIRRAFRILPAFWAYMGVIALVGAGFTAAAWWNSALFLTDYALPNAWLLGHTWSLAVQEQFYLLWPPTLCLLGTGRAKRVAWVLSVGAPLLRAGSYFLLPTWLRSYAYVAFHDRIDGIMVGCLLAVLMESDSDHQLVRFLRRGSVAAFAAIFLVTLSPVLAHLGGAKYRLLLGMTLESFGVGSVLMWALHAPSSPVGRLLNGRAAVHVGVLSYSLYLWQQPFFDPALAGSWLQRFPVCIVAPLVLAEVSYRLIEQPMLRLRERVTRAFAERPEAPPAPLSGG